MADFANGPMRCDICDDPSVGEWDRVLCQLGHPLRYVHTDHGGKWICPTCDIPRGPENENGLQSASSASLIPSLRNLGYTGPWPVEGNDPNCVQREHTHLVGEAATGCGISAAAGQLPPQMQDSRHGRLGQDACVSGCPWCRWTETLCGTGTALVWA